MFRRSLAASTIIEELSERDNTIDAGSECPTGGLRSSRNYTPLVAINTIEPAGYYGIPRITAIAVSSVGFEDEKSATSSTT
jgi:hypothetical protein